MRSQSGTKQVVLDRSGYACSPPVMALAFPLFRILEVDVIMQVRAVSRGTVNKARCPACGFSQKICQATSAVPPTHPRAPRSWSRAARSAAAAWWRMLCLRVNEPRRFFRKHRLTLCRGVVRFYARLKHSRSSVELHRGERRAWNEQSRMTTMLRSVRRNSLSANFVKSARYVSTFFAHRVESQHSPRRDHVLRRCLATVGGRVPSYNNEPILEFKKGSPEREEVYEVRPWAWGRTSNSCHYWISIARSAC